MTWSIIWCESGLRRCGFSVSYLLWIMVSRLSKCVGISYRWQVHLKWFSARIGSVFFYMGGLLHFFRFKVGMEILVSLHKGGPGVDDHCSLCAEMGRVLRSQVCDNLLCTLSICWYNILLKSWWASLLRVIDVLFMFAEDECRRVFTHGARNRGSVWVLSLFRLRLKGWGCFINCKVLC